MEKSKINIKEIIENHKKTLICDNGDLSRKDRLFFRKMPIIIAVCAILCFGIPSETITNIFTVSLSIFIGLFTNLLVLLISFLNSTPENETDKTNRVSLIEDTYYNVAFTILMSIISLVILIFATCEFLPTEWVINISLIHDKYPSISKVIHWNWIVSVVFSCVLYWSFSVVIITLFMVLKRIKKHLSNNI